MNLKIAINESETLEIVKTDEGIYLNNQIQYYEISKVAHNRYVMFRNNRAHEILVMEEDRNFIRLYIDGQEVDVSIKDHISQILEKLGMDMSTEEVIDGVKAPMPGSIIQVAVEEGDEIAKGDTLIILEAMKMENVIKSPVDAIIKKVQVKAGENVEKNQPLISF